MTGCCNGLSSYSWTKHTNTANKQCSLEDALGNRTARDHPTMTNELEIEREKEGEGIDAGLAAAMD